MTAHRTTGLSALAATILTVLAILPLSAPADAGRGLHSYLVDNYWMFVYETRQPGTLSAHVGITSIKSQSFHSQLVQQLGDIPYYRHFRTAAERYLAETRGRCRIVGHKAIDLGEMYFHYTCR